MLSPESFAIPCRDGSVVPFGYLELGSYARRTEKASLFHYGKSVVWIPNRSLFKQLGGPFWASASSISTSQRYQARFLKKDDQLDLNV